MGPYLLEPIIIHLIKKKKADVTQHAEVINKMPEMITKNFTRTTSLEAWLSSSYGSGEQGFPLKLICQACFEGLQ